MRWRWTRIEGEWLAEWLELLSRPWPDSAGLGWLRHAVGHAERSQAYWVPSWVPGQVAAAAAAGEMPGRRALATVAGWGEKKARIILEGRAWVDQISARAKGPGSGESSALHVGRGAQPEEGRPSRGPGSGESSAFDRGSGAHDRRENVETAGRGPGMAFFSALDVHQGAQVGTPAAALRAADPTPASHTQGPSKGPGCPIEGPSEGPPCDAYPALFRGGGAQQGPGLTRQRAQQGPDHARDLRAGRPLPADPTPVPGDPSLFVSPPPPAAMASEGVREGPGDRGPPVAGPGRAQAAAAAAEVLCRARAYDPGLPDRPDRALLRLAGEHPAAVLCLVLDWAARAPDPEAHRCREARRAGVSGSRGPGYVLADTWLLDRIARANAWDAAGRPMARDAQLPAEERQALAEAERARLLAEDAGRWPGWAPPPTWQGLPREYVEIDERARTAQRMVAGGGPMASTGQMVLDQCVADGWVATLPPPGRGR